MGPPSRGKLQRFMVPVRVSPMVTDFPSGAHSGEPLVVGSKSKLFSGAPPSTGRIINLMGEFGSSSRYRHASNFPSGDTRALLMKRLLICSGCPPSIETRQRDCFDVRQDE